MNVQCSTYNPERDTHGDRAPWLLWPDAERILRFIEAQLQQERREEYGACRQSPLCRGTTQKQHFCQTNPPVNMRVWNCLGVRGAESGRGEVDRYGRGGRHGAIATWARRGRVFTSLRLLNNRHRALQSGGGRLGEPPLPTTRGEGFQKHAILRNEPICKCCILFGRAWEKAGWRLQRVFANGFVLPGRRRRSGRRVRVAPPASIRRVSSDSAHGLQQRSGHDRDRCRRRQRRLPREYGAWRLLYRTSR